MTIKLATIRSMERSNVPILVTPAYQSRLGTMFAMGRMAWLCNPAYFTNTFQKTERQEKR